MDKTLYTLHKARDIFRHGHKFRSDPAFGHFKGRNSQNNRKAAKRALRRSMRQTDRIQGEEELRTMHLDRMEEYNQMLTDLGLDSGFDVWTGGDPFDDWLLKSFNGETH